MKVVTYYRGKTAVTAVVKIFTATAVMPKKITTTAVLPLVLLPLPRFFCGNRGITAVMDTVSFSTHKAVQRS